MVCRKPCFALENGAGWGKRLWPPSVLVGTCRKSQYKPWILQKGLYNYPIGANKADLALRESAEAIKELWLCFGDTPRRRFSATFLNESSVEELARLGYPKRSGQPHGKRYLLFHITPIPDDAPLPNAPEVPYFFVRLSHFARSPKAWNELKQLSGLATQKQTTDKLKAAIARHTILPKDLLGDWFDHLFICENATQLNFNEYLMEPYDPPKHVHHAFVDLFAGCGGLSLGLEEAGFTPVLVNELNPDAMATYLANRVHDFPWLQRNNINNVKDLVLKPDLLKQFCDRIRDELGVDVDKGELDLVCGGPPCQGYSGIGFRRSYSVDKNQLPSNYLYQDMAFLVNRLNPKIFLFENVRGLLTSKWDKTGKNGEIFEDVLKTFKEIGKYHICFKLVHAKDYGVPQNRPRILIVGLRKDVFPDMDRTGQDAVEAGFLPNPTGGAPDLADLLGDLIDPKQTNGGKTDKYVSSPKTEIQRALRTRRDGTLMKKGTALEEQDYSKHAPMILEKFTEMLQNGGIIPERFRTKKFSQRLLPAHWDEDGPSITACSAPDDYVHFLQPRNLTVREWARLQMFPDWYVFRGKRTTGGLRRAGNPREGIFDRELPKYTQIGNAVPVGLARKVGEHFIQLLESHHA